MTPAAQVAPPSVPGQVVTLQSHRSQCRKSLPSLNMKSVVVVVLLLLLLCYIQESWAASNTTVESLLQCPANNDLCDVASRCCMPAMDSYGWIAAAVGWSLWVFTLILMCIFKVMELRPNEPKYLQA